MTIDKKTNIGKLLKEYPWLVDELVKENKEFAMLKNPAVQLILKTATLEDASGKLGVNTDTLVKNLTKMIADHK